MPGDLGRHRGGVRRLGLSPRLALRAVAMADLPAAGCTDTQVDVLVELVALFAELDWST
ncbi:MAG: hypothetical protein ACRDSZ_23280 [Pseudonocardiaceae bacterium]